MSHSSERYAIEYKGKYSVDLGDGTSITFDGSRYFHHDSNGKILHVVKKGIRPPSGIPEGIILADKIINANIDLKGEIIHPGKNPLSLGEWMTDEETKNKKKREDEFYKRQRKP